MLLRKQTSSDPYMTDYVKHHPDKYRAVTIAGEIANIIKTIHQGVPLFIVPAQVAGGGGAGPVTGECDISISPSSVFFDIPAGDTGQIAQAVTFCSGVAQTVIITPIQPSDSCLTLSVFPSSIMFTAGECVTLNLIVAYSGCSAGTFTFDANISTPDCETTLSALGLSATGQVSTNPTFVLEIQNGSYTQGGPCPGPCSETSRTGWGAYAFCDASCEDFGSQCGQSCGPPAGSYARDRCGCQFTLRVRSVNNYAGTLTSIGTDCTGCTVCGPGGRACLESGINYTLTAGQTVTVGSTGCCKHWTCIDSGGGKCDGGFNCTTGINACSYGLTDGSIIRVAIGNQDWLTCCGA